MFVLIDTGGSNKRAELERELVGAGCQPGHLQLIVLTHGGFDHSGNAAYLRDEFGTKIAMHEGDTGMAKRGDMLENATEPATNSIMDDSAACEASLKKLQGLEIDTVYRGHGKPFAMGAFLTNRWKHEE